MKLDWLFKNLKQILKEDFDSFPESIIYMDSEQLTDLYSSFTGLKGRPKIEVQQVSCGFKTNIIVAGTDVQGGISKTYEISDSHLLKIILPKLKQQYQEITRADTFKEHEKKKVWIKGKFKNTLYISHHMDTRRLKVQSFREPEFYFEKIKCKLLITENYLSSLYRPIFLKEIEFEESVELLGLIHSFKKSDEKLLGVISPIVILRI